MLPWLPRDNKSFQRVATLKSLFLIHLVKHFSTRFLSLTVLNSCILWTILLWVYALNRRPAKLEIRNALKNIKKKLII